MKQYILGRVGSMALSLWGLSVLIFLMVHLIPGNPARAMLGERATESAVRQLEEQLGLNEPLPAQYLRFAGNVARLQLGRSIKTNRPVRAEVASRFPATLELTLAAMAFAVVFGLLFGIVAAAYRGGAPDMMGMTASLVGVSLPIYCLGLVLILVFSTAFDLLPSGGRYSDRFLVPTVTGLMLVDTLVAGDMAAFRDAVAHLILPAVTLGTVPLAIISRMTRSSLLEVLDQDYIRTAYAKGLTTPVVLLKHALKNALIPVITIVGLEFGYLLGGAVLTESIFSWPGVGRWLWLSVAARDLPAIQGGVLFVAALFMTITLVVDLLYAVVDPRIRAGDA
ncbi:ABC transporter permease [Candidatus Poribacteria bacterium]|jgi:peptide/nickel transport system permease protein|nr:ABC transporter permease [Candidatus Poribacteria bacterium]MBT5531537.1 ABC transporter permease [Candidatus Poribacteria bacterium]MBT7806353.1 ABC transporter permease [Candidatus Poribacteria bacterium]